MAEKFSGEEAKNIAVGAAQPIMAKYSEQLKISLPYMRRILDEAARGSHTEPEIRSYTQGLLLNVLHKKNPALERQIKAELAAGSLKIDGETRKADSPAAVDPKQELESRQHAFVNDTDKERQRVSHIAASAFMHSGRFTPTAEVSAGVVGFGVAAEGTVGAAVTKFYKPGEAYHEVKGKWAEAWSGATGEGSKALREASSAYMDYMKKDAALEASLKEYGRAIDSGDLKRIVELHGAIEGQMAALNTSLETLKASCSKASKYDQELTRIVKEDAVFLWKTAAFKGMDAPLEKAGEIVVEKVGEHVVRPGGECGLQGGV